MNTENIFYDFILSQMRVLIDQGEDPTFTAFQNTPHWKEIKEILPRSQLRSIIQTWDKMYAEMHQKAQSL